MAASHSRTCFGLSALVLAITAGAAEPVTDRPAMDTPAMDSSMDGPRFTADGRLLRPDNYREWITIGTGLNMAYGPAMEHGRGGPGPFTNVFVNPAAYRAFLQSGIWPEQTLFILEIRAAAPVNKSAGANGYYQGELLALEAEVKDARFAGKWAFFSLGDGSGTAGEQLPASASCYDCHAKNAAVDNTFVQFYPLLRDIAKQKGTFKQVPEIF